MQRRGFLRLLGATAAGVVLATTPEVEEITRRFWPGYRAGRASYDSTQIIAGRDVLLYTAPWQANKLAPDPESPWGTPWAGEGFTRDGLHFVMRVARTDDVYVDQAIDLTDRELLPNRELLPDPILRVPERRPRRARRRYART